MAAKSKPYTIIWEGNPSTIPEINHRLALQLSRINEMLDTIFKALEDHNTRLEALE